MAKNFELHPNDKCKSGQRPPSRDVIPFDSGRRGRNESRPINSDKAESEVSWPGFWPRNLASAGPIFLIGIALLCGLYTVINYKKSTAASLKSDEQLRSVPASQSSSPVQALAKPSPNPPAVIARAESSILPEHSPDAVLNSPGSSAPHYRPMRYEATHKKVFGSCTGQLELTSVRLHFKCANEVDLNIPVGSIARAHKDGVVLASGVKYHFLIANRTKGQVEAIFTLWLNRVQRSRT